MSEFTGNDSTLYQRLCGDMLCRVFLYLILEKMPGIWYNRYNAKAKYPNCSLADLYNETTMPPELRKAHQANDFAVMAAYGFPKNITESECVAELMKMYREMTDKA